MSKTIYKEALDIIEEIGDGDTLYYYGYYARKGLPLSWEVDRETLMKIKEALEQAQKQWKLLDMYREYFRLNSVPKNLWNNLLFNRLLEVQKIIKELENE